MIVARKWRLNNFNICGEYPREEFVSEPGGGNRGRGEGDLHGFLPPSIDLGGLYGREVPMRSHIPGRIR